MVGSTASTPSVEGFVVGQRVLNFGSLGKIVEVRPDGDLVLIEVGLMGSFEKWIADPAKCEAVDL